MGFKVAKRISYLVILVVIIYLAVVGGFLITKSAVFLTLWEIMTIVSAPFVFVFLGTILSECSCEKKIFKYTAIISMSGCVFMTTIAHFVNLTITRPLIEQGVDVPLYFQIGQWPSLEMALDYLAWGLFLGFALICTSLTIANKQKLALKSTTFTCGIMCIIGFLGPVINIVNLWYIAVLGYTLGLIIMCSLQIRYHSKK